MRRAMLAGVVVLAALCACVRTNATLLNAARAPRPAVAPDSVVLYLTAADVHAPYEEIALLHAKGDARWTDEGDMYNSMRKKAGALGANGVILDATTDPSGSERIASVFGGGPPNRKGKAVAIYVRRGRVQATVDSTRRP